MRSQRPDNPFDAMRRVINHEANQDDDGGFFAKLGGIDPEPDDDGPTAKGLFQHMHRDKGGTPVRADLNKRSGTGWNINQGHTSGPHLQWGKNIAGKPSRIYHLIKSFMAIEAKRKRNPIVKVRRNDIPIGGDVLTIKSWEWECHICKQTSWSLNWWTTQNSATRHARNHH